MIYGLRRSSNSSSSRLLWYFKSRSLLLVEVFLSMAFGFVWIGETIKNSACHLARVGHTQSGRQPVGQLSPRFINHNSSCSKIISHFLFLCKTGQKTAVEEFSMPEKTFPTVSLLLFLLPYISLWHFVKYSRHAGSSKLFNWGLMKGATEGATVAPLLRFPFSSFIHEIFEFQFLYNSFRIGQQLPDSVTKQRTAQYKEIFLK